MMHLGRMQRVDSWERMAIGHYRGADTTGACSPDQRRSEVGIPKREQIYTNK